MVVVVLFYYLGIRSLSGVVMHRLEGLMHSLLDLAVGLLYHLMRGMCGLLSGTGGLVDQLLRLLERELRLRFLPVRAPLPCAEQPEEAGRQAEHLSGEEEEDPGERLAQTGRPLRRLHRVGGPWLGREGERGAAAESDDSACQEEDCRGPHVGREERPGRRSALTVSIRPSSSREPLRLWPLLLTPTGTAAILLLLLISILSYY